MATVLLSWGSCLLLALLRGSGFTCFLLCACVGLNVLKQVLHYNKNEPPLVFHWFPLLGSTHEYGKDPEQFFRKYRAKYGDVFTFILLGKKTTVCLGVHGSNLVLNGKISDLNADEVYRGLTVPVFGKDVAYDVPYPKMAQQKKFLKYGLTKDKFESYVPLFEAEFRAYFTDFARDGSSTIVDIAETMAEITIFTASRTLQGPEVRECFDHTFAELYHDLDMGFAPINFVAPWLPTPGNRKRDRAQKRIAQIYKDIVDQRRKNIVKGNADGNGDIISHLMQAKYRDGTAVPDHEIAHMMIGLLMAGQHSSASIGAWIMLRLASRQDIQDELYQEQQRAGTASCLFSHLEIAKLPLHSYVVRETLRLHAPIHSIMRKVRSPLAITTRLKSGIEHTVTIPTTHVVLAAPGVTAMSEEYFNNPSPFKWEPIRWMDLKNEVKSSLEEEGIHQGSENVGKSAGSPYLPFGAGRHRCIGEKFAYLQLTTLTALMVREFALRPDPVNPALAQTDYSSLFSKPKSPARIVLQRRDEGPELKAKLGRPWMKS